MRAKTRELDLGLELRLEPIGYGKCGGDGVVKTHAIGARVRVRDRARVRVSVSDMFKVNNGVFGRSIYNGNSRYIYISVTCLGIRSFQAEINFLQH